MSGAMLENIYVTPNIFGMEQHQGKWQNNRPNKLGKKLHITIYHHERPNQSFRKVCCFAVQTNVTSLLERVSSQSGLAFIPSSHEASLHEVLTLPYE